MKWIGEHIWDFVSRFRNKVVLEDLTESTEEYTIMVKADGELVKSAHPMERSRLQVRNDEGSTIPAGAPLYSKGEIGGSERILVGICDADDAAKMPCIGVAEVEMNTTSTKDDFAITQGVYNTNISGFSSLSDGDVVYVSSSGSAPYLTQVKPTGEASKIQNVGIVLKTNGTVCQGLLVSAIGRANDVPNLNSGYVFYGNGSNQAVSTQLSTLLPPDLTVDGAGTINANNVPTLNQDTTGTAAGLSSTLSVASGGTGATTLASNSVLTGNGTSAVQAEADLTYDANYLTIGNDGNNLAAVSRRANSTGDGGRLSVQAGDATGTNNTGGSLFLSAGRGTGTGTGGNVVFYSSAAGSSGNSQGVSTDVATISSAGDLQIDGDLTVDGNNITNNSSASNFNISSSRVLEIQHAGVYSINLGNSTNTNVLQVAGDPEVVSINGTLLLDSSDTPIVRSSPGTVTIAGNEIQTVNNHRHFINFGVNLGYSYSRWIPWGSYYILEQNTDTNPEYTTYVAPHDGKFIKLVIRSEYALGDTVISLYRVGDGTERPSDIANGGVLVDTKTVGVNSANTAYTYTFDSDATFNSGDAMARKIDPAGNSSISGSPGVTGTFVMEFDLTT